MRLAELDVNVNLSLPRKRVHLDLICSETIDIQDSVAGFKPNDTDTPKLLLERESSFGINPFYFESVQTDITPAMRVTLGDWMMQVSSDFLFNRETFQIAINIVDKTLSTFRVSKNVLQLVGLAALIIGSKIEELYPPKVSDFAQMAGHAYSHIEIHAMERKVLRCLGWKIMPATLSHWAVWLMTQWDAFVKHSVVEFDIRFKLEHEYSYKLYRQVTGLLDAVVMDSVSLSISQSKLVAACIYLVLQREVCTGQFVGVFEKYFEYWLGATLELASTSTLDRAKEYLQGFLGLPIGYDTPKACEDISRDQLAKSYEDFLGYQTYNLETMPFVKAKLRNNR